MWWLWDRRKRRHVGGIEIKIQVLNSDWRKQSPRCDCCGYDAEWLLKLGNLERLFCERDLLDALFDAMNFNLPEVA